MLKLLLHYLHKYPSGTSTYLEKCVYCTDCRYQGPRMSLNIRPQCESLKVSYLRNSREKFSEGLFGVGSPIISVKYSKIK